MATTTSNFGWPIPQSTDLVKDGATAIASLGSGVDTSMAELKGGTTGQILSKTSNTDMDFTWVTPNPGDITGVTAGTGITGGGTSGDVTVSIDPTYYLLANQTRRNPVLNSNMSVWQRGTSISASSTNYTADRWAGYFDPSGRTVSRQATSDTTNLPNIQYCARIQRNSGNTNTTVIQFTQSLETVNSIPFTGKTVTLSFYARKGADYSPTSSLLNVKAVYGTGTDQNYTGTYTGATAYIDQNATLTTTWQRFTYTGTIATTSTELAIQFQATPVGTAGTNDYFEITGVQLEIGSTATDYRPNGNTYQAELAACQRYYWRQTASGSYSNLHGTGFEVGTTSAQMMHYPPVTMRVKPSSVDYSAIKISDAASSYAITALALDGNNTDGTYFDTNATISGGTAHRPCMIQANNNSAAYIGFSAEL